MDQEPDYLIKNPGLVKNKEGPHTVQNKVCLDLEFEVLVLMPLSKSPLFRTVWRPYRCFEFMPNSKSESHIF